jgi:DNA adenine methylase
MDRRLGPPPRLPLDLNLLRLEERLSAAHLRLCNAFVERLDWVECIRRYDRPHTLFYLDPPYWKTEGYGVPFPYEEYVRMAQVLRELKGRAIVSLNDHPDIRAAFEGFHMEAVDINYTVSGGQGTAAREVLIFSWDDANEPVGLF